MNKERILELANVIERHSIPGLGFNMSVYGCTGMQDLSGHGCGTVGCIAGHAVAHFELDGDPSPLPDLVGVSRRAAEILGLDFTTREDLFCPEGYSEAPEMYPPAKAVAVLRHLAETGEVDWAIADAT